MALSPIARAAVLQALEECERLGEEPILQRYVFGPARSYRIRHANKTYPSKAVAGVAHGYVRTDYVIGGVVSYDSRSSKWNRRHRASFAVAAGCADRSWGPLTPLEWPASRELSEDPFPL